MLKFDIHWFKWTKIYWWNLQGYLQASSSSSFSDLCATHSFQPLTSHVTAIVTTLLPLCCTYLSQVTMGRYPLPYLLVNAGRKGKRGIPIIQNRAGQPCHWSNPFKRWKVSTAKRLGDMSGYKLSKHVQFGWLDVIDYRFESQLQTEDVIRREALEY